MLFHLDSENDPLISRIENSIQSGRISHAYLIEGASYVDKPAFAESLAKGILCPRHDGENCGRCPICSKIDHSNHEDLIYISRLGTKQSIGIDQIRQMQTQVSIKPNGERYIVIIDESETMTEDAQNCLLKTLEEPPGGTVLLVLTENSERLLPTVRSRCIRIRIEGSDTEEDDEMNQAAARILESLFRREPYYQTRKELGEAAKDKQQAARLIDRMEERCRKLILSRDENGIPFSPGEVSRYVDGLEKARTQLSQGLNPGYVLKRFLLSIGG